MWRNSPGNKGLLGPTRMCSNLDAYNLEKMVRVAAVSGGACSAAEVEDQFDLAGGLAEFTGDLDGRLAGVG